MQRLFPRFNLCPYAGSCESETEEDFCTNAFGMQLYKNVGGLRLYLTEDGAAAGVPGTAMSWNIDDGTVDESMRLMFQFHQARLLIL